MESSVVDVVMLVLRVNLGVTLALHGLQKVFLGGRIPGTAGWFESLGMKPGKMHAVLAASTEIGAGVLFAAGLLTPLAAAAFVGLMSVAAWTHRHNGFFVFKEGWEYNLMLALTAVGIAMLGPGRFALDRALGIDGDLDGWTGLAIAGGGGLAAATALLAAFYRPAPTESHGG